MTIEWNKVTWYSKLLAIIIFVGTFWLGFNLGVKSEHFKNLNSQIDNNISTTDLLLAVDEVKSLGVNEKIKLVSVEDSRCPSGVQCIWAGTVKAKLALTSGGTTQDAVVELGKEPVELGQYMISLVSVKPEKSLKTMDYRLLFHVEHI
jgi:hypothetical protein